VRNDSIAAEIRRRIDKAGSNPDFRSLIATLRPALLEVRRERSRALDAARGVLTKAQWARVPEDIRSGGFRRPGGP
jgi:hypothetical protein